MIWLSTLSVTLRLAATLWTLVLWRRYRRRWLPPLAALTALLTVVGVLDLVAGEELVPAHGLLELSVSILALLIIPAIAHILTTEDRVRRRLEGSQQRFRELFERSLAGIYFSTPDGTMIDCNPAFARIYGYANPEQAIATPAQRYHPDQQARGEFLAELRRNGRLMNYETHAFRPDGEVVWTLENVILIGDRDEEVIGGTVIDVTERKQVEEERQALIDNLAARGRELERINYTVTHDLKSPLVTIRGFLGLLERDSRQGDADRVGQDLERIYAATDHMRHLLDDLLQYSRLGRPTESIERFPLGELTWDVIEGLRGPIDDSGVAVSVSPRLPMVSGNRSRLRELLQNLIENAIKFTNRRRHPRIDVGVRREGGRTVCFVRDNGEGIEAAFHEKIFGLFERVDRSREGTGLGLAIAKRIVEDHGGQIWVESKGRGRGAAFCFTLRDLGGGESSAPTGEAPAVSPPSASHQS